MRTLAVGLLVVASFSQVTAGLGHHDDTFYEEYEVGGHSHPRDEDDSGIQDF